ncbi:MAG: NAD(P)/FAD-dependent oxidoreductase [Verrucomicrobiia bacterium]|jgi:D-amino-acid dehydrogenase
MGKQIVIVGGGVIGFSVAYHCLRAGHEVTVLERGGPDRDCCSIGNAGMVVPSHFIPLAAPGMVEMGLRMMPDPESPFYIRPRLDWDLVDWGMNFLRAANQEHVDAVSPILRDLHLASRSEFVRMATEPGFDFGLAENGLLLLCKTRQALEHEIGVAQVANSLGVPAEYLSSDETAALDPGIAMDIEGSVYFPRDCHLQPDRFLQSLVDYVIANGGQIRWNSELSGWNETGNGTIAGVSNGNEIEADWFVLAGGAHSTALAKSLGLHLPMQAGKGYSLTLRNPVQLPKICSILTEARVAVTPMGDALRFGGTMEIAGLDKSINPARVHGIMKSAPQYFPEFAVEQFEGIEPWAGLRPCSPDGVPYLGRTRQASNLIVATGHAMLGLSLAPVTGQIVADIASGKDGRSDLELLSPDRYLGW